MLTTLALIASLSLQVTAAPAADTLQTVAHEPPTPGAPLPVQESEGSRATAADLLGPNVTEAALTAPLATGIPALPDDDAAQLVEYSDAYLTRLTIHRWASYLTLHSVLMLLSDAGFVATGLLANTRKNSNGIYRGPATSHAHRNMAIASMATSLVGYVIMLPPFRKE